jgi:penicillin-binding protein 1A
MSKRIATYALSCILFYSFGLLAVYLVFSGNLPDLDELEGIQHKRVTKVYSTDGQHLRDFLEENREVLAQEEIPPQVRRALIATEDRRFYSHWGIDMRGILRALFANFTSGDLTAEGASTLTQQLARNLFPAKIGNERRSGSLDQAFVSYSRKIREMITAVQLERLYTKEEILTMYLNKMYFGHGRSGLKTAARYYFDKEASDLSVSEAAVIIGLLKAPTTYSPINNPENALRRRNTVINNMARAGFIKPEQADAIKAAPIAIEQGKRAATYNIARYFTEYVRLQLQPTFGVGLYRDGLQIETSLDSRLQRIAEKHFAAEIGKVQKQVDAYLKRKRNDPDLPRQANVQAAFLAMDPASGRILAMIGGRDFHQNKFNRATQALRQPGSSFKPFVYTAALDNGRFPTDLLEDNAITIREHDGQIWDPENYDKKFLGPMTLRQGFKQSRNLISIKLAMEIGPERVVRYAVNMGITNKPKAVYSIGVGTSEVTLLEMVAAYGVYPNKGIYVPPTSINQIKDATGQVTTRGALSSREALRPAVAVLMTDVMRAVLDESGGTGRSARTRYGLKVAAAGKTGTTNSYADAWFIGFTPHIVAGVWVGMDDPNMSLWPRQSGAVAALPLWASFMTEVYASVEPYRSRADEDFDYPEELVHRLAVCQDTYKLATRFCPRQEKGLFMRDSALPETCPLHGVSRPASGRRQRF